MKDMSTKKWLVLISVATFITAPQLVRAQHSPPRQPRSQVRRHDLTNPKAGPSSLKRLEFKKNGGVVYKRGQSEGDEYELTCDVYVPHGEGPYPAILAVHGGSWTSGTKLHVIRHAWRMAARGYVVVAINYRHAPKHKFPTQVHDCKHAVRWMRHNADKYKIDPSRIAGYGYSAGGHLVSLLGTTDSDDGLEGQVDEELRCYDTCLQAVAAGGAPCEFEWVGSSTLAFWIGATKNHRPQLYHQAAPTTYIDKDDPPFFLYHGEKDALVPLSSTLIMRDKLKEAGIECTHETLQGKGHFWTFSDFGALDRVLDFFDRKLKKNPTSN